MKDLRAHSIGYSFEQQQQQQQQQQALNRNLNHERERTSVRQEELHSENYTQPPAQHPLLELDQFGGELERRERQHHNHHSISEVEREKELQDGLHFDQQQQQQLADDTMQEGQLFDCPLEYERQQQSSNFINYCKQNNNPHQSINKPTDGTGSSASSASSRRSSISISNKTNNHNNHIIRYLSASEPQEELEEELFQIDQDEEEAEDSSLARSPLGQLAGRPFKPVSSPIQVPARRSRRGLHSMKLNMMKVEEEAAAAAAALTAATNVANSATLHTDDSSTSSSTAVSNDSDDFSPVRRGDRNRPGPLDNISAFHDDDAFLEREFNENHYNHYLVDGFDDQHLTAEEDPMRLFASIQALARSLHEDAELFGSLPPKRMLESPIRSMAYAR